MAKYEGQDTSVVIYTIYRSFLSMPILAPCMNKVRATVKMIRNCIKIESRESNGDLSLFDLSRIFILEELCLLCIYIVRPAMVALVH